MPLPPLHPHHMPPPPPPPPTHYLLYLPCTLTLLPPHTHMVPHTPSLFTHTATCTPFPPHSSFFPPLPHRTARPWLRRAAHYLFRTPRCMDHPFPSINSLPPFSLLSLYKHRQWWMDVRTFFHHEHRLRAETPRRGALATHPRYLFTRVPSRLLSPSWALDLPTACLLQTCQQSILQRRLPFDRRFTARGLQHPTTASHGPWARAHEKDALA